MCVNDAHGGGSVLEREQVAHQNVKIGPCVYILHMACVHNTHGGPLE
jgi:hypothetical protein